jgi:hypothetical protein
LFAQDGDIVESVFDGSAFGSPSPLDTLNTRGLERSPMLTENALYLSSNGRIMTSPIVYGAMLPMQAVEELDTGDEDMSVVVDRHDTSMLIARRPAGTRSTLIFRTQRDPVAGMYETPLLLMEGTTSSVSLIPDWVSEDGCVMYLESSETGDFDIYVARRSL